MTGSLGRVARVSFPFSGGVVLPVPVQWPELGEIEVEQVLLKDGFGLLIGCHVGDQMQFHIGAHLSRV
jgi:hypothetical protein